MQQPRLILTRRPSFGFTLVSTLVGMAVGLLSIAAMLTLYRNLVQEAKDVKAQSFRDGQVATSSLASQEEIQQAGFGIAGATVGTDLVVLSGATLTGGKLKGTPATAYASATNGNAVIWGFNPTAATGAVDPAGYLCEGLVVTSQGLQLLPPTSCKSAAHWQSVTWQPKQLASTGSLGPLSMFQANAGSCWPYQQQAASGSSLQLSYYLPTKEQESKGLPNVPGDAGDASGSTGSSKNTGSGAHSDNGKGNDYGADKGNGKGNSKGGSDAAGGSSGTSDSSTSSGSSDTTGGSSRSSTSDGSSSSAVTNVPTFSVCLPNFQQGTK
jgi:hypothetical protein